MKKRIKPFAVMLCMMLLFSASACGDSPKASAKESTEKTAEETTPEKKELDAKQIFLDSRAKNKAIENADMAYTMQMKLAQGEENLDVKISMDIKAAGMNTDALQYAMSASTDISGQQIPTDLYYKDGYYYMNISGQKIKYAVAASDAMSQIESSMGASSFDADSMKSLHAEEEGDNIILTFEADAAAMNGYVKNALRSMEGLMHSANINVQKVTGTEVINKDGCCSKSDINIVMTVDMDGTPVDMDMTVSSDIKAVGDAVTVTFPEDLETYTEIDPSLMNK